MNVAGVVLAGGRSSRLGGTPKAGLLLGELPLLQRVLARFEPQVASLVVNCPHGQTLNLMHNAIEVADLLAGYAGPLTGLMTAFDYYQKSAETIDAVAVVPCDGPFLPIDLVSKLTENLIESGADVCCIRYGGQRQPTFSLWRTSTALTVKSERGGFKCLLNQLNTHYLDWPESAINPFFNINTPEDLAKAHTLLEPH